MDYRWCRMELYPTEKKLKLIFNPYLRYSMLKCTKQNRIQIEIMENNLIKVFYFEIGV